MARLSRLHDHHFSAAERAIVICVLAIIMGSLFMSGALLIATNRELFRNGLKPHDFVKSDLQPGTKLQLDVGGRLDAEYELKKNGYRADQVQAFLPGPMATATAMYHSGKNPLRRVTRDSEEVHVPKGLKVRRLHKAFLRYHDANNWPMLRAALKRMGREDLIGNGKHQLVPRFQPRGTGKSPEGKRVASARPFRTQHTR